MKLLLALVLIAELISEQSHANLCGDDSRVPSEVKPIGRLYGASPNSVCTVTLVSQSCVITAGHCLAKNSAETVEFNVPNSKPTGEMVRASAQDQYQVEKRFGHDTYIGRDWAVLKLRPNLVTGKNAGEVQGSLRFYQGPIQGLIGQVIRITGYGSSLPLTNDFSLNHAQQTSTGPFISIEKFKSVRYAVDAEPGNSGSALIDESTQSVIGVHTNGGCATEEHANEGTTIEYVRNFRRAIESCIASE